jgi:hypothetical protein
MGFNTEPTDYKKTALSDLQGAWQCLRREIAENPGFDGWEQALFHIDEAMSWECVRNLRQMNRTLVLVRNLIQRGKAPEGVLECLKWVNELMAEILKTLDNNEI